MFIDYPNGGNPRGWEEEPVLDFGLTPHKKDGFGPWTWRGVEIDPLLACPLQSVISLFLLDLALECCRRRLSWCLSSLSRSGLGLLLSLCRSLPGFLFGGVGL